MHRVIGNIKALVFTLLAVLGTYASACYAGTSPANVTLAFTPLLLDQKQEIELQVHTTEYANIKLRPVVSAGAVEILNATTQTWVSGTDTWEHLPTAQPSMRFRLKFNTSSTAVSFVLQDTQTLELIQTQKVAVWSTQPLENYAGSLNTAISNFSATMPELHAPPDGVHAIVETGTIDPKKYALAIGVAFSLAALAGFAFKHRQMLKWRDAN